MRSIFLLTVAAVSAIENGVENIDLKYEGELEGFDIEELLSNNDVFEQFAKNVR
jgi:hypothetical protein